MPATNLSSCQKRGGRCAKRSLECRREQENHSQKVCNASQIFQLYQGIDISTKKRSTKMPLCLAFGTGEGLLWYGICVPYSKKASWGTRRIFGSIRCKKQASTVRKRYSVPKTAFCGTRRIFRGALNSLLLHRMHLQRPAEQPTPQTVDSFLGYATHFQRRAVPKAASCRTGRIFSARNGPRALCSLRRPLPLLLRRHSVPETAPARR